MFVAITRSKFLSYLYIEDNLIWRHFFLLPFSVIGKRKGREKQNETKEEKENEREHENQLVIPETTQGITSHHKISLVLIDMSPDHTALLGAIISC